MVEAAIKTIFPRISSGKRGIIVENINAVIEGLKPAFLWDVCSVNIHILQRLLEKLPPAAPPNSGLSHRQKVQKVLEKVSLKSTKWS
jgi:hypothetical protein